MSGRLPLLLLTAALACHTGSANTITGAVVMTTLAVGSSAASRASGGCYAVCQQGEQCNERTGLCEALPCRGQCTATETCEESFWGSKCMPAAPLSVTTKATAASAPAPQKPAELQKPPVEPQKPAEQSSSAPEPKAPVPTAAIPK